MDPATLLFSTVRDVVNLRDYHPPPMQAFMLWQTFLQNVNPLSKGMYSFLPEVQINISLDPPRTAEIYQDNSEDITGG